MAIEFDVPTLVREGVTESTILETIQMYEDEIRALGTVIKEHTARIETLYDWAKALDIEEQGPYSIERKMTKMRKIDYRRVRELHQDALVRYGTLRLGDLETAVGKSEMEECLFIEPRYSVKVKYNGLE